MAILSRIMRFFSEEKEPKGNEKRIIKEEDLFLELERKSKEIYAGNEEFKELLSREINKFAESIKNPIRAIEGIDLNEKKENEKIKSIVKENVSLYATHSRRLVESLKRIENPHEKNGLDKFYFFVNNFKNASRPAYEKGTILVGKEMQNIRETINNFYSNYDSLIKNNQQAIKDYDLCLKIGVLIDEDKRSQFWYEKVKKEQENLHDQLSLKEKEKSGIFEEMERIKNCKEYKLELKRKEESEEIDREIDEELRKIKARIDFRGLLKVFHHDEKKSSIIKRYAGNFKSSIVDLEDIPLIEIAREALHVDLSRLEEIREKLIGGQPEEYPLKAEISRYENKLKEVEIEIKRMNELIIEEERKIEKLKAKKRGMLTEIKELSRKLFKDAEIV